MAHKSLAAAERAVIEGKDQEEWDTQACGDLAALFSVEQRALQPPNGKD